MVVGLLPARGVGLAPSLPGGDGSILTVPILLSVLGLGLLDRARPDLPGGGEPGVGVL